MPFMDRRGHTPILLMVSGGSDSTALLELACACQQARVEAAADTQLPALTGEVSSELGDGSALDARLRAMMRAALPDLASSELTVLHVNHMLRGTAADADEAFVASRCADLVIPCVTKCVDVPALARERGGGFEAVAREVRYKFAEELLGERCAANGVSPEQGVICTAHTLDDRIETFLMRTLVGTGPGGFGSIPRSRGNIRRPLLDAMREELRAWLRARHPGVPDSELWREDATNDDGSNFRSQVRTRLVPVFRELRPGFEPVLARTMDLVSEEDAMLSAEAESVVYRNLSWDGTIAHFPASVLAAMSRPLARRTLRIALLVVNPDARLEATQIDRVLDGLGQEGFTTEVAGGIRVRIRGEELLAFDAYTRY